MQANRNKAKDIIYRGVSLCCSSALAGFYSNSPGPALYSPKQDLHPVSYSLFLPGEEEREVNNFCFPSVSSQGKRR